MGTLQTRKKDQQGQQKRPTLYRTVWQYGLWSFQTGFTKLERFLPKKQHVKRIFLNFENWINLGPQKLAKVRVLKIN